jgi:NACalpha-BTF3-like transcription factor
MKVTLEQIDELRNRVNVSYEEAKSTLEKNDGDLIKSIIELENKKGRKYEKRGNFTSFANRLLALKMSIKSKDGDVILNVALVIALAVFMMAPWVGIFVIALAVLTSCKIRIYKGKSLNVNDINKNVQETVEKIKTKSEKIFQDEEEIVKTTEETENEIIIE